MFSHAQGSQKKVLVTKFTVFLAPVKRLQPAVDVKNGTNKIRRTLLDFPLPWETVILTGVFK